MAVQRQNPLATQEIDKLVSEAITPAVPPEEKQPISYIDEDPVFTGESEEVASLGTSLFKGLGKDIETVYKSGPLPTDIPEAPLTKTEVEPLESSAKEVPIGTEAPLQAEPGKITEDAVTEFQRRVDQEEPTMAPSGRPRDVAGGRVTPETILNDEDMATHLTTMTAEYRQRVQKMDFKQVIEDARRKGWSKTEIDRLIDPKQSMYATPEDAATSILIRMDAAEQTLTISKEVAEAMKNGALTPELKTKYLRQKAYEAAVIRGLTGKKTDVGRTLAMFNQVVEPGVTTKSHVQKLFEWRETDTAIRLSVLFDSLNEQNAKGRGYMAGLLSDFTSTRAGKYLTRIKDMMYYQYYSSMLSSPDTFARIIGGSGLFSVMRAIERPLASGFGQVRYYAGKAIGRQGERPIGIRELTMNYAVTGRAFLDAFTGFNRAAYHNQQFHGVSRVDMNLDRNPFNVAIPDESNLADQALRKGLRAYGFMVSIPQRGIIGMDDAFKAATMRIELSGLATREAEKIYYAAKSMEGVSEQAARDEAQAAFEHLIKYPSPEMWEEASRLAADVTLTAPLEGPLMKSLENMVNAIPGGRIVIPFVRTPGNLILNTADYIPIVGLANKKFRDDLFAGGIRTDQAVARMGMGMGLGIGIHSLIDNGDESKDWGVTGAMMYPDQERKRYIAMGEKPFSIWVNKSKFSDEQLARLEGMGITPNEKGRVYIPYTGFEPGSAVLAAYATAAEYMYINEDMSFNEALAAGLIEGSADYMADMSMLTTIGNIFEAGAFAEDGEKLMAMAAKVTESVAGFGIRGTPMGYGANFAGYVNRLYDQGMYQQRAAEGIFGGDYSDQNLIFRSVADALHQHRLQNPLWQAADGSEIKKRYNLMTGDELYKEGSSIELATPIRKSTRSEYVGWNTIIDAGVSFPTRAPKKLEGVILNGAHQEGWEYAYSSLPITDETGAFMYGGRTYGQEMARMALDTDFTARLNSGNDEIKKEAVEEVQAVISDAKNSAKYYLMSEFPSFRFDIEDAEIKKQEAKQRQKDRGQSRKVPVTP